MRRWLVGLSISVLAVGIGCQTLDTSFVALEHTIQFGTRPSTNVNVYLADSSTEHTAGLGNRAALQPGQGMVFVFPDSKIQTFWMKDTSFPIDIVWVQDGVVMGVEPNIQPEAKQTLLSDYKLYSSKLPVNMVIELPAGFTANNGIASGLTVTLD